MNETPEKVNTPVDPDQLYAALEEKIRHFLLKENYHIFREGSWQKKRK